MGRVNLTECTGPDCGRGRRQRVSLPIRHSMKQPTECRAGRLKENGRQLWHERDSLHWPGLQSRYVAMNSAGWRSA